MKRKSLIAAFTATSLAVGAGPSVALTADEAKSIAMDAYVYGYSLLTTEVTRVQMSNVPAVVGLQAPMGMFINVPKYPPADYRGVSAPNADTLYSLAWLDLSEPQVFSHPDMGDRFYLFEVVDLWMTALADAPSKRTAGGEARDILFTGPGWSGTVPDGMQHVPMDTSYMVILGRTYADGTEADYKAVNALQAELKITPLSDWGTDYSPKAPPVDENTGISMADKPQTVILDMNTKDYFDRLADLMCKAAPPTSEDAQMVAKMAEIGIEPCKPFDISALDADTQNALETLPKDALDHIVTNRDSTGEKVNGWIITKGLGGYGTDYLKRAVVAAFGWPANREKDAVYPYTEVDSTGATLTGANKYTLTFAKGEDPPIKGFWSITMYEINKGWWFVPNALNKFTVSPRDNLVPNEDGSVTLYLQTESPGKDKEANWLPAPKGDFIPMLRMYWPSEEKPSILDSTWTPPAIVKAE